MKTCEIKENLPRWMNDEAFHTIAGECGTLILRVERLQLALANLSVMSPHYTDGKFEDHSSALQRMKQYARECLAASDN